MMSKSLQCTVGRSLVPPLQRRDDTDVCHRGVAAGGGGGGDQQQAAEAGHSYTQG